jgi:hypothetical protein
MNGEDDVGRFGGKAEHGWSPDLGSEGDTAAAGAEKERQPPSHHPGEDRPISQAEREGTSSTEMEPESASGESRRRSGEDIAAAEGKEPEGYKGQSQRPYGKAD